jgi:hypothetical protein
MKNRGGAWKKGSAAVFGVLKRKVDRMQLPVGGHKRTLALGYVMINITRRVLK